MRDRVADRVEVAGEVRDPVTVVDGSTLASNAAPFSVTSILAGAYISPIHRRISVRPVGSIGHPIAVTGVPLGTTYQASSAPTTGPVTPGVAGSAVTVCGR